MRWQSQSWEPDALISFIALGSVPGLAVARGGRVNKNFILLDPENGNKLEYEGI